jgi:hypothetical protein
VVCAEIVQPAVTWAMETFQLMSYGFISESLWGASGARNFLLGLSFNFGLDSAWEIRAIATFSIMFILLFLLCYATVNKQLASGAQEKAPGLIGGIKYNGPSVLCACCACSVV